MAQLSVDPAAIEVEVGRVRSLGLDALRQRWRSMFGGMPPAGLTKDLIARMMAHRVQEDALGGLDRQTIKLLDRLARGDQASAELNRRLKPGTVLIREYQGERHSVTVVPNGFVWQDTIYSSLSTIARAITGTTWNGPRFFGLRGHTQTDQESEVAARAANRSASVRPGSSRSRRQSIDREVRR